MMRLLQQQTKSPQRRLSTFRPLSSWTSSQFQNGHTTTGLSQQKQQQRHLSEAARNQASSTIRGNYRVTAGYLNPANPRSRQQHRRWFNTEAEYHNVADEAMEHLQDTIEEVLEENGIEVELSYASGVLTMALPPHGTYVLNKQTPNQVSASRKLACGYLGMVCAYEFFFFNPVIHFHTFIYFSFIQQIWWSSPISGPRRYEYNDSSEKWVFTKDPSISLGQSLAEELKELYDLDIDLDV